MDEFGVAIQSIVNILMFQDFANVPKNNFIVKQRE
jgi:hypothetical protein